jgi:LL-diaminopimelate aminotransferase
VKPISKRMESMSVHFFAEHEAKVRTLQSRGIDIIRLDVGSPDLPPAPFIIDALNQSAAEPDHHGYQPHAGPFALRSAWVQMYQRLFGVDLDAESEVVALQGSKEGIFHLSLAFVDEGDIVLIPDPSYFTYARGVLCAGGRPHYLPLLPELGHLPDLGAVPKDVAKRAKILWLNYPNNPTAATATLEFFSEAVNFARHYDLLLIHDAAYTQVTYDDYHAPSILEVAGAKDVSVEFNSLSKSHNMAGWRVGVGVGNAQALRTLFTLKSNVDSGHFLPIMQAATMAMTGDQSWIVDRNKVYRQRRDVVIQALHALGLKASVPKASLYVWSPVPEGNTSVEFSRRILEQAHVSVTPGVVFGKYGEGYIRISLVESIDRLEEAMNRLSKWIES